MTTVRGVGRVGGMDMLYEPQKAEEVQLTTLTRWGPVHLSTSSTGDQSKKLFMAYMAFDVH